MKTQTRIIEDTVWARYRGSAGWSVWIGPYYTREIARAAVRSIASHADQDTRVVALGLDPAHAVGP